MSRFVKAFGVISLSWFCVGCATVSLRAVPVDIPSGATSTMTATVAADSGPMAGATAAFSLASGANCGRLSVASATTGVDGSATTTFVGANVDQRCDAEVVVTANNVSSRKVVRVWPDFQTVVLLPAGDPVGEVTLVRRSQTTWEYRVECRVISAPAVGMSSCTFAPINILTPAMPNCAVSAAPVTEPQRQPSILKQGNVANIAVLGGGLYGWRILDVTLNCQEVREGRVEFRMTWAGTNPTGPFNVRIVGPVL